MQEEHGDDGRDAYLPRLEDKELDGDLQVVMLTQQLQKQPLSLAKLNSDDPLIHGSDSAVAGREILRRGKAP